MAKKTGKRGRKKNNTAEVEQIPQHVEAVPGDPSPGPLVLPSPEDSVRVLAELAALNDRAIQAHRVYLDRKEAAKIAKEKWETLAGEVQERLRQTTHASDLPLFDGQERENDQARMEQAAAAGNGSLEVPAGNASLEDAAF